MLCAAGELCTIPGLTPEAPDGQACWKALAWGAWTLLMTRRRTATMRGRGAGAPCHRLTLTFPRALASWTEQRRRAAMAMPPSICRRQGWRSSKDVHSSQCGSFFFFYTQRGEGGKRSRVVLHGSGVVFLILLQ